MIKGNTIIAYRMDDIFKEFNERTKWNGSNGRVWNSVFNDKPTYEVEYYAEHTFEHEKDHVIYVSTDETFDIWEENISLDFIQRNSEKKDYENKKYLIIPFDWIVNWLRNQGVVTEGDLIVTNTDMAY